jgi:hypothetical protein
MKRARLVHDDGREIAALEIAETAWERATGLLGRALVVPGTGMWLAPTRSIHTWWMRFAIDLVFLDDACRVVKIVSAMQPFRLAWGGWHSRVAVELAEGEATRCGLAPGQQLRLR